MQNHCNNVDILFLVFVMYNFYHHNKWRNFKHHHLDFLENCIRNLDVNPSTTRLHEVSWKKIVKFYPCDIIFWFTKTYLKSNKEKLNLDDQFISNLIWIIDHHCKSQLLWQNLIPLVRPDSPMPLGCKLADLIGTLPIVSLCLCAQPSINDFCEVLEQIYTSHKAPVKVSITLSNWLPKMLRNERSLDFNMFDAVTRALDQFRFDTEVHDQRFVIKWKHQFISELIQRSGDRTFTSLQLIYKQIKTVGVEHSYHDIYRYQIIESLSTYLGHYQPPMIIEVRNAIKDSIGDLLGSKDLMSSMMNYVHRALSLNYVTEEEKIILVEDVYSNFTRVEDVDTEEASKFLYRSLKQIMGFSWPIFFQLASKGKQFFSIAPDDVMLSVAGLVIEKANITENINKLPDLFLFDIIRGRMMTYLCKNLTSVLCDHYEDIKKVINFYNNVKPLAKNGLEQILDSVLLNAVEKWNPDEFKKIASFELTCLRTLGTFFSRMKETHESVANTYGRMTKAVMEWNRKFKNSDLSFAEINNIISLNKDNKWTLIESILNVTLISESELQESLRQIEILISLIRSYSHEEDQPIFKILRKYGCTENMSTLDCILCEWEDFPRKVIDAKKSCCLAKIQRDAEILASFADKYKSEIKIAHYMGSLDCCLFYNAIGFGDWSSIGIEEFLDKVSGAKRDLLALLKCKGNSAYAAVKEALDFLSVKGRDLIKDVDILVSCPTFF